RWLDLFSRDNMPIDVIISPEVEIAKAVQRRLEVPGAFEVIPFSDGKVRVVGVHLEETCPVLDTPLRQLTELFPELHITVLAVVRNEKLFVPSGDDPMQEGDSIYFAVDEAHLARAMTVFGHEEKEARRIVIVGGGNVGLYLAKSLEDSQTLANVNLIERDVKKAEHAAGVLSRTMVINGDALDAEILKEANAQSAETLVAVANEDEVNILASLLAKRLGAERVITLVANPIYGSLLGSLGIDVYVDPRETTVSTIIQHIRRGRILGLHTIRGGEAEIIEAEALETSPLVGQSIKELKLPPGIMIGAIVRDDEVLIPRGDTVFEANDRAIMLAQAKDVKKIEQMFSVRLDYF
ncbi:MAG: Trk system potassium transporter TrkA, partial [Sphingomonadales bacterium]